MRLKAYFHDDRSRLANLAWVGLIMLIEFLAGFAFTGGLLVLIYGWKGGLGVYICWNYGFQFLLPDDPLQWPIGCGLMAVTFCFVALRHLIDRRAFRKMQPLADATDFHDDRMLPLPKRRWCPFVVSFLGAYGLFTALFGGFLLLAYWLLGPLKDFSLDIYWDIAIVGTGVFFYAVYRIMCGRLD